MIPQEKSAAVTEALRAAFGVTEFEDIRLIHKGHSALVFRIAVRSVPYLLKIITRSNAMLGPERQFACMKAAAEAGLAPRVRYTSVEEGISITDFVESVAFPAAEALLRIPAALRALHALPPFPGVEDRLNTTCLYLMKQGTAVDEFFRTFRAANILSAGETDELFAWHAELASVYRRDAAERDATEMVSSHNDLFKPDNILFDGQRVWLVDWEAAFLNDRYADLAVVANLVVTNEAEERVYLQEYFGHAPDEYQLARFFLMKQIAHLFYAMVFLLQGAPVTSGAAVGDFQRRFWTGEVRLTDKQMKTACGRFHWDRLAENMRREQRPWSFRS